MELEYLDRILKKEPDEAAEELLQGVEELYGEVPYILQSMKDRPELLISKVLYDNSIMREFKHLDHKTIELISIGVSSALRCKHCLNMHLRVASRMGISREEIFATILIAGSLANASVLAEGTRALDAEVFDDKNTMQKCDDDICKICEIPTDPQQD